MRGKSSIPAVFTNDWLVIESSLLECHNVQASQQAGLWTRLAICAVLRHATKQKMLDQNPITWLLAPRGCRSRMSTTWLRTMSSSPSGVGSLKFTCAVAFGHLQLDFNMSEKERAP